MSDALSLRLATPDDREAMAALLTELGYPTSPDEIPDRMRDMTGPDNAIMLAELDGAPVGLLSLHAFQAIHARKPVAMIMALVVSPDARGRGVGRALVQFAEQWAMERGCGQIMVTSAERRADAHAFYPACGMQYTGRRFAKTLVKPA